MKIVAKTKWIVIILALLSLSAYFVFDFSGSLKSVYYYINQQLSNNTYIALHFTLIFMLYLSFYEFKSDNRIIIKAIVMSVLFFSIMIGINICYYLIVSYSKYRGVWRYSEDIALLIASFFLVCCRFSALCLLLKILDSFIKRENKYIVLSLVLFLSILDNEAYQILGSLGIDLIKFVPMYNTIVVNYSSNFIFSLSYWILVICFQYIIYYKVVKNDKFKKI